MNISYKNKSIPKLTINDIITGELFAFIDDRDIHMKVGGSLSELINCVRLKDGQLRTANKDASIIRVNGTLVID